MFAFQLKERNPEDMKRIYFALAAAGLLVYLAGCCAAGHCPCSCGGSGCSDNCAQSAQAGPPADGFFSAYHGQGLQRPAEAQDQGQGQDAGAAAAGAITYPYYTNRGPRDYFDRNPASIGP
jgi:hypothetical protein